MDPQCRTVPYLNKTKIETLLAVHWSEIELVLSGSAFDSHDYRHTSISIDNSKKKAILIDA